MRKIRIFMIFLCTLLIGELNAQITCGTPSPHELDSKLYLSNNLAQLRQTESQKYRIRINPIIVHPENEPSVYFESDVNMILNHANEYLSEINVELFIIPSGTKNVFNEKFVNLKLEDEADLRQTYDVNNALNIYFLKSISLPDQTFLNGYTNFPAKSQNSNRILISYLDKNTEDFKTLKNKIFLHELGHYFGLLHTFQDSNNPDISKRELVTRVASSNCATTGDLLCDTPADPFEREPLLSSYYCNDPLPATLLDAQGNTFQPPLNNIMSYHIRCGDVFTNQQYIRMKAGLGLRISSENEYDILEQKVENISFLNFSKNAYCKSDSVKVGFISNLSTSSYYLEISDNYGKNFQRLPFNLEEKNVSFQIPENLAEGNNYLIRLSSENPSVIGISSSPFAVTQIGEIKISSFKTEINAGDEVNLRIDISGNGPWYFQLSDGSFFKNIVDNTLFISRKPTTNQVYSIKNAIGYCGLLKNSDSLNVKVYTPQITIDNSFNNIICENSLVSLKVNGLNNVIENSHSVIIEGNGQSFIIRPQFSAVTMNFYLPNEIKTDKVYNLSIRGNNPGAFSSEREIIVRKRPGQPLIASPLKLCYNDPAEKLRAEGQNLKWYLNENDLKSLSEIIPNSKSPGKVEYFVSQSNEFGCESDKSKIEVLVSQPVSAIIDGNNTIITGDSTRIRISLTGDGPWKIKLNDGTILSSNIPIFDYYVKPLNSTVYEVEQVKSNCGTGIGSGSAEIKVLNPLAVEIENSIKLFPNPTEEYLDLIGLENYIGGEYSIYNSLGIHFLKDSILKKNIPIKIDKLPAGRYYIKLLNGPSLNYSIKFEKK